MPRPWPRAFAPAVVALALAGCSGPAGRPAASPATASLDPGRPLPSPLPEIVARVNGQPIRIYQILPVAKTDLDRVSVAERDKKKPEVLRHALEQYVDRELLLQEALARGIQPDSREVGWAYDQLRREYPDDGAWTDFLARQGTDPQSLRAELRAQQTVSALIDQELRQALGGETDPARVQEKQAEVQQALVARLRAKARIELFL